MSTRHILSMALIAGVCLCGTIPGWAQTHSQLVTRLHLPVSHRLHFAQSGSDDGGSATTQPDDFAPTERKAFQYSLYGTLLPLPTLVFTVPGLIVGPSLGYFHAGLRGRAWTGIGLRTLAMGGVVSSFVICGWDCGPGDDGYTPAWIVFLSSSGLLVGSAIYDIATVKGTVRQRYAQRRESRWSVSPVYYAQSSAIGLRLRIGL